MSSRDIGLAKMALKEGEIMPTICDEFKNYKLALEYYENQKHRAPHIHVFSKGRSLCSVDTETLTILTGFLDGSDLREIRAWIVRHKSDIRREWKKALQGEAVSRISWR
jgi:hypothetical protein